MIRRISVRGLILHQGKLLCVRHKASTSSTREKGRDYWCLPGGGLEEGEALLDAMEREMVEETGVKPQVGNLLYIQQFSRGDKEYLDFFFHVTNGEDYRAIDLASTTHGLEEIAEIAFVDPTHTYILPEFLSTEPLAMHVSSQEPAKVISRLSDAATATKS